MIKKLKRTYTILATVSILVLMTVLVTIMNIINYTSIVEECDSALSILPLTNIPEGLGEKEKEEAHMEIPSGMSPEVPYESRFFMVKLNGDGTVIQQDVSNIISIDETTAKEYAAEAFQSNKEKSFIGSFRYQKTEYAGETTIYFLDCGRKLDTFYSFLRTSILVGLLGCVFVCIFFIFISGKIVKPIAQSYEKQKRFISDAGHEIKTPLTIINANLDLLLLDGEEEELLEIQKQTARLTKLTNNLVYLSKMEEPSHTLALLDFPFSDLIKETVSSFKPLAESNEQLLEADIQDGISYNGSPDALQELLNIVLDNAIKYTPKEGFIKVRFQKQKKNLLLTIENDSLYALDQSNISSIFDRFYRMDASRNSQTGGHGIGLSIAKAIVEGHHGTIQASAPDEHTFLLTLQLSF